MLGQILEGECFQHCLCVTTTNIKVLNYLITKLIWHLITKLIWHFSKGRLCVCVWGEGGGEKGNVLKLWTFCLSGVVSCFINIGLFVVGTFNCEGKYRSSIVPIFFSTPMSQRKICQLGQQSVQKSKLQKRRRWGGGGMRGGIEVLCFSNMPHNVLLSHVAYHLAIIKSVNN